MRRLALLFRAAADENRLKILTLMRRHEELCVCDVMYAMNIPQSKASRHLRHLYLIGFLKDRRDGVWIHYRMSEQLSPAHYAILEAIRDTVSASVINEMDRRLANRETGHGCENEGRSAAGIRNSKP